MTNSIPGLSIATISFDDIHSPACQSDDHTIVDKVDKFNEDPKLQENKDS